MRPPGSYQGIAPHVARLAVRAVRADGRVLLRRHRRPTSDVTDRRLRSQGVADSGTGWTGCIQPTYVSNEQALSYE
jgi:hypothetical protein